MKKSVFFAVPAYRGIRCVPFYESLEATVKMCEAQGWETHLSVLQGCCYVQAARNELVKTFMDSGAEFLFFLDDDLSWDCKDAIRLLQLEDELVCGIYPYKTEEEDYPVVIMTRGEEYNYAPIVREDGCIAAVQVPTGFMRIRRSVIEKMIEAYPQQKYINTKEGLECGVYYDLFPQGVFQERWWGDDYAFCRLWGGILGEMWVVPDINFTHHGFDRAGLPKAFPGNYHEFLLQQPGGSKHDPTKYHPPGIPGWTSKTELCWLFEMAKGVESVVEIGSWYGRSTHALLSAGPVVYAVDHWEGSKNNDGTVRPEFKGPEGVDPFTKFVEAVGTFSNLEVVRKDSVKASESFRDKSVDAVFIDAGHTKKEVLSDIAAWVPKVRKLICGHDYDPTKWPEVKQAVDQVFGDRVKLVDTIWYVEL